MGLRNKRRERDFPEVPRLTRTSARRRKSASRSLAATSTPRKRGARARSNVRLGGGRMQLGCREETYNEEPLLNREAEVETLEDFLYTQEEPPGVEHRPSPDLPFRRLVLKLDSCAPVNAWLEDMRSDIEEECTSTLQSKRLPRRRRRDDEPESRDLRLLTATATTAAKKMIDVADRFDKLHRQAL
jgi:hypothetical protein